MARVAPEQFELAGSSESASVRLRIHRPSDSLRSRRHRSTGRALEQLNTFAQRPVWKASESLRAPLEMASRPRRSMGAWLAKLFPRETAAYSAPSPLSASH